MALIEVGSLTERTSFSQVRLGRLARLNATEARGLGFPAAQAKRLEGRDVRDTESLAGWIEPGADLKEGLLALHLRGSVPVADATGRSPWRGCSGAAVFCGPLLVGIVRVDPANFRTDRLKLVPVTAMAPEPSFASLLAPEPGRPLYLEAIENLPARDLLAPPYRALPRKRAPSTLVRPAFGVVPFHGRNDELADLDRWAATEWSGTDLALVHAPARMSAKRG